MQWDSAFVNGLPLAQWIDITFIDKQYEYLHRLAQHVIAIAPSTGEAERNLSLYNDIHANERNRLATSKVDKLVFIVHNVRLFNRIDEIKLEADDDGSDDDNHLNTKTVPSAIYPTLTIN
jgi:hypothetical protein